MIGGWAEEKSVLSYSIERIQVTSIPNLPKSWTVFTVDLNAPAINARAVSIDDYIMVICGGASQLIQLIDTKSGKVTQAEPLSNTVYASSVIKVNNVIYSFGDNKLETLYVIFYFCRYTLYKNTIYFYC